MEGGAVKLAAMLFIGYILVMVGVTGRLGSLLGAIIDPANMLEENNGAGGDFGGGNNGNTSGLPTSGTLTPVQIGQYATQAGFTGNNLVIAIAVALAESGGQIAVTHKNADGSTDYGLWQINSVHKQFDFKKLLQPLYNAQAAYKISGGYNWTPWVTFTTGAYLKHMNEAQQAAQSATLKTLLPGSWS